MSKKTGSKKRNLIVGGVVGVVLIGMIASCGGDDDTTTEAIATPEASVEAVVDTTTTPAAEASETTEPEPEETLATATMPDLTGMSVDDIEGPLTELGFPVDLQAGEGGDLSTEFSQITSTDPAAGDEVTEDQTVVVNLEPTVSLEEQNAIQDAQNYLNYSNFSRAGLVDQLSSEYGSGYTTEAAEAAVAYLEANDLVDWYEQAVAEAESYLEYSSFSRAGLVDQLTSEYGSQFTQDQAEHAVNAVGY